MTGVIPQMIEDMIVREETHIFGLSRPSGGVILVIVCWLANGYAVTGKSDFAMEGQFERESAQRQARERAKEEIRGLEMYIRCQLNALVT